MALGIPDVKNFDFMDKPTAEALQSAFQHLVLLGAIEDEQGRYKVGWATEMDYSV